MTRRVLAVTLAASMLSAADFPSAQISNGAVTASFYLPDPEKGYYRGTRFDWSGVINSLRTKDHEYFGVWFEKYDPKLHDAITGPVEEFITGDSSLGYEEAGPGGVFVRIGVGAVRRPADETKYQRFGTYDIIDAGKWTTRSARDRAEFTHELGDHGGYSYRYTKVVRLMPDSNELRIEHTLRNTGKKPISTMQYNHNFFTLDGRTTGPDTSVTFPFTLKAKQPVPADLAEVSGGNIAYKQELPKGKSVFAEFEGFGSQESDFDINVTNKASGAGVRIRGDRPIAKLIFWSISTTVCPEPYIQIDAAPGEEARWTYTYNFK
ncbi:MAG TPA: hypothetical protein VES20_11205 [Bryobacteraceae bacterium]|nr:hypothetical protein [Bryobacteraceae bacterium]